MKVISKILIAATAAFSMCTMGSLSAAATSIGDVTAALRDIGVPESVIQQCMNYYNGCQHDATGVYDKNGNYYYYEDLVDTVYLCQDTILERIDAMFPTTTPAVTTSTPPASTGSSASGEETTTTAATTTAPQKRFIDMTLAEKQAYVGAMSETERENFLANLTKAERNSIIKQLSTDDQLDIAQSFIDMMKQFGMNMTVDNIANGNIDISVRDDAGTLIDASTIGGTLVDDTGWNLTAPFVLALSALLLSLGGLTMLTFHAAKQSKRENADA